MKRILCAAVVLALLTGAGLAEASGNLLGLSMLAGMTDGTQSAVISPLSLQMALSMAREGAAGKTREELDALLEGEQIDLEALLSNAGYADAYALEGANAPGLRFANAGFVAPGCEVLPEYQSRVEAEWFPLDADAQNVNDWVRKQTNGHIETLLNEPLSPDVMLCLVNALCMEAKWATPFAEENTRVDAFYAPDGETQAEFMYVEHDFRYGERDGVQLVRLPYEGTTLAMYVALPEAGGMPALLDALCTEGMTYFEDMQAGPQVHLSLPKFSISTGGSLLKELKAQGLNVAATTDADFSNLCAEALYIGDVIQNVRVDVDEQGTSAAAVTALLMCGTSMPMQPPKTVDMNVDRPFFFAIADEESGAIAFAGVVTEV